MSVSRAVLWDLKKEEHQHCQLGRSRAFRAHFHMPCLPLAQAEKLSRCVSIRALLQEGNGQGGSTERPLSETPSSVGIVCHQTLRIAVWLWF